jgi:hypothetical protein
MNKIELPKALAEKYELVQQPASDELYFGSAVGTIVFSSMTEVQAERLIQMKSPYIRLKEEASTKPTKTASNLKD